MLAFSATKRELSLRNPANEVAKNHCVHKGLLSEVPVLEKNPAAETHVQSIKPGDVLPHSKRSPWATQMCSLLLKSHLLGSSRCRAALARHRLRIPTSAPGRLTHSHGQQQLASSQHIYFLKKLLYINFPAKVNKHRKRL